MVVQTTDIRPVISEQDGGENYQTKTIAFTNYAQHRGILSIKKRNKKILLIVMIEKELIRYLHAVNEFWLQC
jgi:hypothetical protein